MTEPLAALDASARAPGETAPARARAGRIPWWAWGSLAFVFLAVGLEVLGGQFSNSPVPRAAEYLAPIAWPQWLRVVWWLAVAAAAGAFRFAERRAGIRRNPVVILASIVPFVIFAWGIATGASFSTWH